MRKERKKLKWFLPKPLVITAAASLAVAAVFLLLTLTVADKLYDQQAAQLWETDGDDAMRYAQISVFFARNTGLSYDGLMRLRYDIDQQYIEDGISSPSTSESARLWIDAASAESTVSVTRETANATAAVTAVIGDYFKFHPVQMMSGQYLNPDEASKDVVLLDWNTAWRLFGGYEVVGMQVEVSGQSCIVGGVFKKEQDDIFDNRIIMSFELYELINGSAELNVLEFILPNPVSGHGMQTLEKHVGASEENRVMVENSARFKLKSLFEAVTDFSDTIAQSKSIALPYYENRARVAEFRGGVFLLLAAVFAILPAIGAVMALVKIYRRRSAFWPFVKEKLKRTDERIPDDLQENNSGAARADDDADNTELLRQNDGE